MKKGYILLLTLFLILLFSFTSFTILLNLNIEITKVSYELELFKNEVLIKNAITEIIYRLSDKGNPYYLGEIGKIDNDWSIIISDKLISSENYGKSFPSIRDLFSDSLDNTEIKISYKKKDGLLYFYDEKNNIQFIGGADEFGDRFKPVIFVEINLNINKMVKKVNYEIVESSYSENIENPIYYNNIYYDSINPIFLCNLDHSKEIPFNTQPISCEEFHLSNTLIPESKNDISLNLDNIKWKHLIDDTIPGFYKVNNLNNDIKGKGILYFEGDKKIIGNYNIYWKGLVYINGSLIISDDYSGSIWICGALFVKNDIVYMGKRERFITIFYSSENLKFFSKERFLILNERRL